jgi:hypothetical protein
MRLPGATAHTIEFLKILRLATWRQLEKGDCSELSKTTRAGVERIKEIREAQAAGAVTYERRCKPGHGSVATSWPCPRILSGERSSAVATHSQCDKDEFASRNMRDLLTTGRGNRAPGARQTIKRTPFPQSVRHVRVLDLRGSVAREVRIQPDRGRRSHKCGETGEIEA